MSEGTGSIFISYRREESAAYAGRIADSFVEHFGKDRVFRDLDAIGPGLDFVEVIEQALDSSEVLIAVIGKNWLSATDTAGQKRLENPNDLVRNEIATALKRGVLVIPLLIERAAMPSADELPDDLAPLARRNAFELSDFSWNEQVQRLIITLDETLRRKLVDKNRELEAEIERLRATMVVASLDDAVRTFDRLSDEIEAVINDEQIPVTAPSHRYIIRKTGEYDVAVYQRMQVIRGDQLDTLSPDVRETVETYDIAMKELEKEWTRIKRERATTQLDPTVREKQIALVKQMKEELVGIVDFLGDHGVYLDDHYILVRRLVSKL